MRVQIASLCLLWLSGCDVPQDNLGDPGVASDESALSHDARCNEGDIRAVAPPAATAFLDRAFSWVHDKIPYCQCPESGTSGYRADCSGLVSFSWQMPNWYSTREYPGGYDNQGTAVEIGWDQLTIGDALNFHVPKGTKGDEGHIMMFAGWLDSAHTKFCSIEEYETGYPAGILTHSIYESWPVTITNFHPIRKGGYDPGSASGGEPPAQPPPPSSTDNKYWVDTFDTATGYPAPGSGAASGHLYAGTNYVYCKVWGPNMQVGSNYNHYWLKTDLDDGSPSQGQYVSAYYLSRWGNDIAKDNSGTVIPDCAGAPPPQPMPPPSTPPAPTVSKFYVDTFATADGYASPGAGAVTGHLYAGTNYVYCKVWGPNVQVGSNYNHYWMKTDLDDGSPWQNQYVSAYYLSKWGNDVAKDNNGVVLPDCQ
jgi:hypothetical protein